MKYETQHYRSITKSFLYIYSPFSTTLTIVRTTFKLTYKTSKSTVRYMVKVIVRDTTKPLLKQL